MRLRKMEMRRGSSRTWALLLLMPGVALTSCGESQVEVRNTAPIATITAPIDGLVSYPGEVIFTGTVADAQDTDPSALTVTWVVSGAGDEQVCPARPEPDGTTTCVLTLEAGSYQALLRAVDPEGQSGEDMVAFTLANDPPTATILTATDTNVLQGEPVTLEGTVADTEEAPELLSASWSSSIDGPLATVIPDGDGSVRYSSSSFTPGSHVITLTVMDPRGLTGSDQITLVVQACPDKDGDGYDTCERAQSEADCNDADPQVYPNAEEVCDGKDNDCDTERDEGFDLDGDGYLSCPVPSIEAMDCDDGSSSVYPGAVESCNGVDDNCDGTVDEDIDGDGDGITPCGGDCDDGDATVYSGATEICDGQDNDCLGEVDEGFDQDTDGVTSCAGDCDDGNPNVQPGANEVCNRVDDDCNGTIDENFDQDGDGYTTCGAAPGLEDCNDLSSAIFPGAEELCNTIDDDCDGQVDEGVLGAFFPDSDGDAHGAAGGDSIEGCSPPTGYVADSDDCDDTNSAVYPGAEELCNDRDDDCDGLSDEDFDLDGDGYTSCGSSSQVADCDDGDEGIFPSATEICDAIDNNCDGVSDEGFDTDGDGYTSCGSSTQAPDCNDGVSSIHPEAAELCDGLDQNCDGQIDEGFDLDGDGVTTCLGDCDDSNPDIHPGETEACNGFDDDCDAEVDEGFDRDQDGYTSCAGDCDDTTSAISPGVPESCNGQDDNCNGAVDEGLDGDGDGYSACGEDCDDSDASIHPSAEEVCDGVDQNCDGVIDDGFDGDGDGLTTCGGDCDDQDNSVYPGATEQCNLEDDDCDGVVDEDFDQDGDGHISCQGDCNDGNENTYPGADEICDEDDNDCDGVVDEGVQTLYYEDSDGDGFGSSSSPAYFCSLPDGYSADNLDCDDGDGSIYPDAPEGTADTNGDGAPDGDGKDNDCDGVVDEGTDLYDDDFDGYTEVMGDCDDGDWSLNPGAAEGVDGDGDGLPDPDGIDNNCDGRIDEGTVAFDDDGDGQSEDAGDCDDGDAETWLGAPERFDGKDNDCDGLPESSVSLEAAYSLIGVADSRAGFSLTGGGDVNGDGYDDLLIGAPYYNTRRGAVHLVPGGSSWADDLAIDAVGYTLVEESTLTQTGFSVAMAGDMNGDGLADFAVGGPFHGNSASEDGGLTYVVFGMEDGWQDGTLVALATTTIRGRQSEAQLGYALAGGGDVNGDGYDDLLIGAPRPGGGNESGLLMILAGRSAGWSAAIGPPDLSKIAGAPNEAVGFSAAIIPHFDGDGPDDLLIGSRFDQNELGDVWLVTGRSGFVPGASFNPSDLPDYRYYGETNYEFVGYYTSSAGDVNGDGYGDFMIGRKTNGNELDARAYLHLGPIPSPAGAVQATADVKFVGGAADVCPCVVAGAGDVNGDGFDDVLVSAAQNTEGDQGGVVYLFYGHTAFGGNLQLANADIVFYGEQEGDYAGMALSGAGDVNADGYDDFLIGAPYNAQGGSEAGKVYLLLGHPSP